LVARRFFDRLAVFRLAVDDPLPARFFVERLAFFVALRFFFFVERLAPAAVDFRLVDFRLVVFLAAFFFGDRLAAFFFGERPAFFAPAFFRVVRFLVATRWLLKLGCLLFQIAFPWGTFAEEVVRTGDDAHIAKARQVLRHLHLKAREAGE